MPNPVPYKGVARFITHAVTGVLWMTGLLGLLLLPDWRIWTKLALVVVWLTLSACGVWYARSWLRPAVALVAGIIAFTPYAGIKARDDRAWSPEHSRAPLASFEGDRAIIQNFRSATYRTETDFDIAWLDRTVDLDSIRTVDYIVEPFHKWRGLAHVFLSFGFSDGTYVAISVEARREAGEGYSMIGGLLRHFELIYVIGDERDLIGLRANIRGNPVHVYPMDVSPEVVRQLFVSMLERANRLAVDPEFYHSLRGTCALAVLQHVNELREEKLSAGWRLLFPGYSDKLAWEIGLAGFEGTLDEARERFLINGRSKLDASLGDAEWSRRIRLQPAESR